MLIFNHPVVQDWAPTILLVHDSWVMEFCNGYIWMPWAKDGLSCHRGWLPIHERLI